MNSCPPFSRCLMGSTGRTYVWSGLYGDGPTAEREAKMTIGWLRDQISN
jgi:hypothetical protein